MEGATAWNNAPLAPERQAGYNDRAVEPRHSWSEPGRRRIDRCGAALSEDRAGDLAVQDHLMEQANLRAPRRLEPGGVTRAEFIDVLSRFGVSPFQYDAGEVLAEGDDG